MLEDHKVKHIEEANITEPAGLSPESISETVFSQFIEPTLHQRLLELISPALEVQRQATADFEVQISKMVEDIRKLQVIGQADSFDDMDAGAEVMQSSTPLQSPNAQGTM